LLSAVLASFRNNRRFQLEGAVNSAGSAVDWACRLTGQRIEDWRERPLEPHRGPWVLPAFAGLGAPWWQPQAQATVSSLGLDATGEDLLEGVLVGLAMRVLDCTEALAEAGASRSTLRLSGKLTRLRGLVDLLADAGQILVEVSAQEDAGMAGLARLAAAALSGDDTALLETPAAEYRREPVWSKQRADDLRGRWRQFVLSCLPQEEVDGPAA
jgi:glycerol kinase